MYDRAYTHNCEQRHHGDLAARIGHHLAAQFRRDAAVLGLDGRTEIVKAALELLHRRAAEERMSRSVEEFYTDLLPPLPIGVRQQEPHARRADVGGDVPS